MRNAVGIDLGGTFIKGAVVGEDGAILVKEEIATEAEKGSQDILSRIAALVGNLAKRAGIAQGELAGIGLGIPGFLDDASGVAVEVVNIGWHHVAVREPLLRHFGIPVYLDNDANVAALGEAWAGAGRGRSSAFCVTLGTGVGGGIVVDGHVLRGVNFMAGEIGHIVMERDGSPCNCGNRGCLETVSSATGVVRLAREALATNRPTSMTEVDLTAAAVFAAADAGDALATEVVNQSIDTLGRALAIAANLINPEVIVVGGGMSRAGDSLFVPLRAAFHRYALRRVAEAASVVPAELGNDAGVVGAAKLALYS